MDTKKISFGIKLKKPTLIKAENTQEKSDKKDVQFIDCLEESSIKVIGGDDEKTKEPLVIPMKPNKKLLNLEDIVKNNFVVENEVQNGETSAVEEKVDANPSENLSLNELAAKELLQAAKNGDVKETKSKRVIETVHPDKLALEGEKESTLDDYEDVPIEEFGLAMLRGMGWKEGSGIGKNQKVTAAQQPVIRPKGLGLGADKVAKQNNSKPAVDKEGKPLICCKGAFVKVIAGYHKGTYGQIIGLDDESGRFIVKTAMNNMNISLNEFLVTPVTKEDYNKNSKVINNAKYEEYLKKIEQAKNNLKNDKSSSEEEQKSLKKSIKKFSDSGSDDEHYSKKDKKPIKTEKYSSEEEKYDRKNQHEKSDDSDDSDNRKSRKPKSKKKKDRSSSKKRDKKYKSSSEFSDESTDRHRSSRKDERDSKSSRNEEKSSRNEPKSSRYEDNYSRHDERSRYDDRSPRKESRSSRYDNEYSDNRRDEKSSRYEDRSSRYEDRSSRNVDRSSRYEESSYRNDRSSKYDDKYSSKSKYSSKKRSSSRSSEESSSSEEERSRKKSSKHRRDRSSERNSHKSSYKDKERERSRHDKYRR